MNKSSRKKPILADRLKKGIQMAIRRPDGTWHVARTAAGDWDPEEIKSAVRMTADGDGRRWSLDRLSAAHGLPVAACRNAVRKTDADGEALVARMLGVTPHDIWPSRYGRDGIRFHPARRKGSRPAAASRHREMQGAA